MPDIAAQDHVGLYDVVGALLDVRLEIKDGGGVLAPGHEHVYLGRDLDQALEVLAWARLFQDVDVQLFQRAGHLERGAARPKTVLAGGVVLVAVDQDQQVVAGGLAHGLDDGQIVARVGAVQAQLDGLESELHQGEHLVGQFLRGQQPAGGGIDGQAILFARRAACRGAARRPCQ